MPKALIIGAGIGGLTTAIALRKIGWNVEVFEQAKSLREVGAGLTVQANAMRALRALGLENAVSDRGHAFETGFIGDNRGRVLSRFSYATVRSTLQTSSVGIARPELLNVLHRAIDSSQLHCAHQCVAIDQDDDGVTAHFAQPPALNGETATPTPSAAQTSARGDILIGADGIHSAVRAGLFGDSPVRYAGYTCWRGVVPMDDLWCADEFGEHWGRGTRFGCVPLSNDTLYWFAVANAAAGTQHADEKKACLAAFADWDAGIRNIINATPARAILHNDIVDRPPMSTWGHGKITLLGDAAHATTPNMGQGACMAIEDAVVLAAQLKRVDSAGGGAARALRDYEQARMGRANAIVKKSWSIGAIGQWQNPIACFVRNALVRLTPNKLSTDAMMKVWHWTPPLVS